MTLLANRRSAILLFSLPDCLDSHRTRIVIKEKEISAEVHEVDTNNIPDEIRVISPYDLYPSLVDRELILQNSRVIIEYLDERFPHPPLLPVYPVARANSRTLMLRIEREWCPLVDSIISGKLKKANEKKTRNTANFGIVCATPPYSEIS